MQTIVTKDVKAVTAEEAIAFAKRHFITLPDLAFQFLEDWAQQRDLSPWFHLISESTYPSRP